MPASDRETSRDPEGRVRHQGSFSECSSGRASVPMWDSSDPARAPPPLPLNPGTASPTTKPNTSASIAEAARAIVEKARESAPLSSYTSNQTPLGSPERQLVKGAHHRRLQSLQSGNVKDLRSYLDGSRSPDKSPERPSSRNGLSSLSRQESREDIFSLSERGSTPTTPARDYTKETPSLRPSTRQPPRSILGENTPPSATMLALQTLQVPELPLNDITNGPSTPTPSRLNTQYDFSSQLLNLTSIATSLQREMASLSRRSKDNATDLISLKEATNQRDEDIRKSLRQLNQQFSGPHGLGLLDAATNHTRSNSSYGNYVENTAFNSPPSASRSRGVPRASSAHAFLDESRLGSPSPYSVDSAASVAMLEKIIREMVTKEGQERLLSTLSELLEKSRNDNCQAAKKVEELAEFIKQKSESQALVVKPKDDGPPRLDLNFDSPGQVSKYKNAEGGGKGDKAPSDGDMMKMLQRIKDSVAHAGGTTSEVKGLVRDLRGEVLGMGRELGRKLEQAINQPSNESSRSTGNEETILQPEDVQSIVEEGLTQLKQDISRMLAQRADQDDNAFKQISTARSGPDGDEMLAVVKHALQEHGREIIKHDTPSETSSINKDGILDAVREGLKDFEPNIELQQFGLEREEILTVLKEGLEDYRSSSGAPVMASIDKGEVYEAMQEALKDFKAPFPVEALENLKDDILTNVRIMLDHASATSSTLSVDDPAIRASVVEAVKEGLGDHGPSAPRELEISRDDLFDAVKASLDGSTIPFGSFGEQVLQKMHELVSGMHTEFKQYSAANGRDTEQVLDAVKDGLESLRTEIERYVDRAQDVTGKDEIVDTVRGGLEQLRMDVQGYCAQRPQSDSSRNEMLDYIKAEFEHLHATVGQGENSRGFGGSDTQHTANIILAVKEGMESLKNHHSNNTRSLNGDESSEEVIDAMRAEFERLEAAIINAHACDKSELIETIQDSMGALHARVNGSELGHSSGGAQREIIREIQAEFSTLKESIHAMIGDADRDAIVAGVRQSINDMRTQLAADQGDAAAESLGAIKEELENFRDALALPRGASRGADTETLRSVSTESIPDELLEAIRGEFDNLRNTIAKGEAHGASKDEILDAVRLGLDDLRSHMERKLDNPERGVSQQSEMLDALNDGLENLRTELVKTIDKPLDMTVNYEILDTLKEGISGLRTDLDALKSGAVAQRTSPDGAIVLAESAFSGRARELAETSESASSSGQSAIHEDIEALGVLIHQLQIKVEAMDATIQEMPSGESSRSHTGDGQIVKEDLVELEKLIRDVQANVAAGPSGTREAAPHGAAKKQDTDAIETLLRNTKSQLEDMHVLMPDPANTATKEQLESVEAAIRVTQESLDSLADRLENSTAAKNDVAVVEVLAQDVKVALDELKESMDAAREESENKPEPMTKADLDILGVLCAEIRNRVHEIVVPDVADVPSKVDIEQLSGLLADFRESHDKMKESYETDIAVTAKAFDDRRKEYEETVEQLTSMKDSLAEIRTDLIQKMEDGEAGVSAINEALERVEERAGDHEPVLVEVREIVEMLKQEFERSHGSLEALKVDHQETSESHLEKLAEHRQSMITDLGEKIDGLFGTLTAKYDEAQEAAEAKAKAMQDKADQQEELLSSTRAMTDDLKLSIDTLGTALTSFTNEYPVHMEKMSEDSKTVFNRVDDTWNKLDETQQGLKYEHATTRDEVSKVLSSLAAMHSDVSDHNPRFMVALQEVQALIGQHFEHTQKASEEAAEHRQAVRDLSEQLKAGFEESNTRHEAHTEDIRSLPLLMPASSGETVTVPVPEKFDDSALHDKLDQLLGHSREAGTSSAQLERLDQIHEKVMATAAEVSTFVALQAKQISRDHETKESEAHELALLLERRMAKKDEIEDDITVLNEEKDALRHAVEMLAAEKEALAAEKSRLAAEVSSIETALHIRREELHDMDLKAETIERRMMEGVMNQSRMLLLSKSAKSPSRKKNTGRDLRVPSSSSIASAHTVTSSVPPLKSSNSLALKSRPFMARNAPMVGAERRIMSLNQINHNVPTGAHAFSTATPSLLSNGTQSMKRSHSVKTQPFRKPSWASKHAAVHNKENETLSEEDEEDFAHAESRDGDLEDFGSDAGTERRTSHLSGRESEYTYMTDDLTAPGESERHVSYGDSDLSYATGSYITGTDLDGRSSLGSSANGVLGVGTPSEQEQSTPPAVQAQEVSTNEGTVERPQLRIEAPPQAKTMGIGGTDMKHFYAPPSDSGLGTDLPTATFSGNEGSYFGRSDRE